MRAWWKGDCVWCVSRVACRLRACRSTVRLGLPDFLGQMTKCIDDTLMWSDDLKESFFQAVKWLDICGNNSIILNPEKFQFGKSTVEFAGVPAHATLRPSNTSSPHGADTATSLHHRDTSPLETDTVVALTK